MKVVSGAGSSGGGRCQLCINKVESDSADIGAELVEGVGAGLGLAGLGGVAGVDDVGEVELEVVAGAVINIDSTTRTKPLSTGAENNSSSHVAFRSTQTNTLPHQSFNSRFQFSSHLCTADSAFIIGKLSHLENIENSPSFV